MSSRCRTSSIFVKTDPDLSLSIRDAIKLFINTIHDDAHISFSSFPRIIWHCQIIPCPVCDGEGYEIVKCQRLNHIGELNSKYEYKTPCSVCHGDGVAAADRKKGIDHRRYTQHLTFMAGRGKELLIETILGEEAVDIREHKRDPELGNITRSTSAQNTGIAKK